MDLVEAETNSEMTCAEVALRNSLILESLFSSMNPNDLLSARLVNKQWEYAGAKELRRRKLSITLSFFENRERRGKKVFRHVCRVMRECQTPQFLLSSLRVGTNSRNELGSSGIRRIFNTTGIYLQNLSLFLDYSGKRDDTFQKSASLMTHLQHLLGSLVPNLEILEIRFEAPSHWKDQDQIFDIDVDASVNHQNDSSGFGFLLPKLNKFIATGSTPSKFFANVMNAAINLEYLGGDFSRDFTALIKFLMRPVPVPVPVGRSKIHLLKELRYFLRVYSGDIRRNLDIDLMESFLTKHKENLSLETFHLDILFKSYTSYAPRIVATVNEILKLSSGTLEKLRIRPFKWYNFLSLTIPRLPKLKVLSLDCEYGPFRRFSDYRFFPGGFNMKTSFPNVSCIVFLNCLVIWLGSLVDSLKISEPVPSIRHIIIKGIKDDEGGFGFFPHPSDLHHVFPKLVSISSGSSHYYEI